jgi:hypothetical protein
VVSRRELELVQADPPGHAGRLADYELTGSKRCAAMYGGADTVVCLAHGHLSEILDFVRS